MTSLGIETSKLKIGENRLSCPVCDRGPKDTALSVRLNADGSMVWKCHRCDMAGPTRDADARTPPPMRTAAQLRQERPQGLSDYGRQLWAATKPLSGVALAYLEARACRLPPNDGDLRFIAELKHHLSGYVGPALVALVTDVVTGEPLSIHRTWIKPDGSKADVSPPRMMLKDCLIANGVIRLWPDHSVTTGLGIAEGIETALSLAHGFTPVWSCLNSGHLKLFPILPRISELILAEDNDKAGREATSVCAKRWQAHATVRVISASPDASDLNDEVRTWVK